MTLATDAYNDFQEIIRSDMGAVWPCTIKSPAGVSVDYDCRFAQISQTVNPGTNEVVLLDQLTISVLMKDLADNSMDGIRNIEKETEKPWVVTIADILGNSDTYKVVESNPDRTLGNMVLWLERYKEL